MAAAEIPNVATNVLICAFQIVIVPGSFDPIDARRVMPLMAQVLTLKPTKIPSGAMVLEAYPEGSFESSSVQIVIFSRATPLNHGDQRSA